MDQRGNAKSLARGERAAHIKGRAHEFTPEQAREAGRKGGGRSQDRRHMATIGRKGGEAVSGDRLTWPRSVAKAERRVSEDRQHMADIGREGGQSVSGDRAHMAEIGREGGHRRQSQRPDDRRRRRRGPRSTRRSGRPSSQPSPPLRDPRLDGRTDEWSSGLVVVIGGGGIPAPLPTMSDDDDLVSVIESTEATLAERIAAAHALAALGNPEAALLPRIESPSPARPRRSIAIRSRCGLLGVHRRERLPREALVER